MSLTSTFTTLIQNHKVADSSSVLTKSDNGWLGLVRSVRSCLNQFPITWSALMYDFANSRSAMRPERRRSRTLRRVRSLVSFVSPKHSLDFASPMKLLLMMSMKRCVWSKSARPAYMTTAETAAAINLPALRFSTSSGACARAVRLQQGRARANSI